MSGNTIIVYCIIFKHPVANVLKIAAAHTGRLHRVIRDRC
jgi:hypothetical protein